MGHLDVLGIVHALVRALGQQVELLLQHGSTVGRCLGPRVLQRGLQTPRYLRGTGSGQTDLVEGEMDIGIPCHGVLDES